MRYLREISFTIFLACILSYPGSLLAQRFTSSPSEKAVRPADTISVQYGRLAYEAWKAGNLRDARAFLDESNPGNPYAMFVRAALTRDALAAADMYKEIVAENEGTSIAREALLQLYRYHYAAGDYSVAHRDYMELKKFPIPPPVKDPLGLSDSTAVSAPAQQATATQEAPPGESEVPPSIYLVQVGVFTTADNARRFIQQLKVYGVNGEVFTKDVGGRTLYGVSAGSFSSRDAAEDMAADLKGRSVNCIVVEK